MGRQWAPCGRWAHGRNLSVWGEKWQVVDDFKQTGGNCGSRKTARGCGRKKMADGPLA